MDQTVDPEPQPKAHGKRRSLEELLAAATTRPVLDAEEASAFLGVGLSTLYRLIDRGIIPAVRIPATSCIRLRREALDRLLRQWEQRGVRRPRRRVPATAGGAV